MERHIKRREGYTLIELMVGMTIFIVVMTMVIGFFIALYKLQGQYREAANLQQEGRTVSEFFIRNMREVTSVDIVDNEVPGSVGYGDGDICDGDDFGGDGKSDDYIKLTTQKEAGSEVMKIRCTKGGEEGTPRQLSVWVYSDAEYEPAEPDELPKITSDKTDIMSFKVKREDIVTYPKVLKYEITVGKAWDNAIGPGEQLLLRGYINMRNEL